MEGECKFCTVRELESGEERLEDLERCPLLEPVGSKARQEWERGFENPSKGDFSNGGDNIQKKSEYFRAGRTCGIRAFLSNKEPPFLPKHM